MSIHEPGDDLRIRGFDSASLSILSEQGLGFVAHVATDPRPETTGLLGELASTLRNVAHYESLLVSAAQGDRAALRQLRGFSRPYPTGGFRDFGFCPVSPMTPLVFLWAGVHLAGSLSAEGHVRQLWGAYRAMLEHVAVKIDAIRLSAPGQLFGVRSAAINRIGTAPEPFGSPLSDRPFGPPLPNRPFPCFTEEELCLGEILDALREARESPRPWMPTIGAITPSDLCIPSAPVIAIITPATGTVFPASQADLNPGSGASIALVIGAHLPNIVSWSSSAIAVEIPAGFAAGCHQVGWVFVPDPAVSSRLEGVGQQCGRYYSGAQNLGQLGKSVVFSQVDLTIIGAPDIRSFTASKLSAEACEPVELSWRVELLVCATSQASVRLSLLENGIIVQDYLQLIGAATVDRDATVSYALVATSMLGAQQCATVQVSLSVSRASILHVSGPPDACVDINTLVPFQIRSSCPAPAGGLTVSVQSSDAGRFPSATTRINEGETTAEALLATGNVCGNVTVTFAAAGHTSGIVALKVAGAPVIASLSRSSFLTCQPIDFNIVGSCLGDASTGVRVRLDAGGSQVASRTVTVPVAHQQLHATFGPLPAGTYAVVVESCGRSGAAPGPLVVAQAIPSVFQFSVIPSSLDLCDTGTVRLRWRITDASTLVIRAGNQIVATRMQANLCDLWEDEVTTTPGLGQTVYSLTASVLGATATATETRSFSRGSALTTISQLTLANQSGRNLLLWALVGAGGSLLGALANGQTRQVQLLACIPLTIVAVDPALVTAHNKEFNDNLQPTELRVAQNVRFRRWQTQSPAIRFHSTGPAVTATIF